MTGRRTLMSQHCSCVTPASASSFFIPNFHAAVAFAGSHYSTYMNPSRTIVSAHECSLEWPDVTVSREVALSDNRGSSRYRNWHFALSYSHTEAEVKTLQSTFTVTLVCAHRALLGCTRMPVACGLGSYEQQPGRCRAHRPLLTTADVLFLTETPSSCHGAAHVLGFPRVALSPRSGSSSV